MTEGSAARTVLNTPTTFTSISVLKACGSTASTDPDCRDTGVGDHDVDAPEVLDPLGRGGLHRREIAHVCGGRDHAVLTETGRHLLEQHLVEIGEHQLGALFVEAARHFRTDAVGPTRDEGDFSVYRTHGPKRTPPCETLGRV